VPANIAGYQYAATGDAYCSLYTAAFGQDAREFIGSQLLTPLVIGKRYFASIKVSLAEGSTPCSSNNIGITFSTVPYSYLNPAPIFNHAFVYSDPVITDTVNWTTISGYFIADSTYRYIIIGNFFNDLLTDIAPYPCGPYYYVDDVCVSIDSFECDMNTAVPASLLANSVGFFPNPAYDKIIFNYQKRGTIIASLISVTGKTVRSIRFATRGEMDVSSIPRGIYVLRINRNNQSNFFKQIIY